MKTVSSLNHLRTCSGVIENSINPASKPVDEEPDARLRTLHLQIFRKAHELQLRARSWNADRLQGYALRDEPLRW